MKRRYTLALALTAVFLLLSGCGGSSNIKTIKRMQALEEGVSSPTTEAELKEAIQKYQDRVEDMAQANQQIGIWYKLLGSRYLDSQMYGEALKLPQPPTREGYSFTGWYKDPACFEPWNMEEDSIQSALTLYAGWEKNLS